MKTENNTKQDCKTEKTTQTNKQTNKQSNKQTNKKDEDFATLKSKDKLIKSFPEITEILC
jgi:hypothetical protein